MKKSENIRKALGLVTALFISVPAFGEQAQTGARRLRSGKRQTGIRFHKRDGSAKAIGGGGDPRDVKTRKGMRANDATRRVKPKGDIRRRLDEKGKLQKGNGVLVK